MKPSIPRYIAASLECVSQGSAFAAPSPTRPTTAAQGTSMARAISKPCRQPWPLMRIQTTIGQAMNSAIPIP